MEPRSQGTRRVETFNPTTGSDTNNPFAHPREVRTFDPTTGADTNSPFAHAARTHPEPGTRWNPEFQYRVRWDSEFRDDIYDEFWCRASHLAPEDFSGCQLYLEPRLEKSRRTWSTGAG